MMFSWTLEKNFLKCTRRSLQFFQSHFYLVLTLAQLAWCSAWWALLSFFYAIFWLFSFFVHMEGGGSECEILPSVVGKKNLAFFQIGEKKNIVNGVGIMSFIRRRKKNLKICWSVLRKTVNFVHWSHCKIWLSITSKNHDIFHSDAKKILGISLICSKKLRNSPIGCRKFF